MLVLALLCLGQRCGQCLLLRRTGPGRKQGCETKKKHGWWLEHLSFCSMLLSRGIDTNESSKVEKHKDGPKSLDSRLESRHADMLSLLVNGESGKNLQG